MVTRRQLLRRNLPIPTLHRAHIPQRFPPRSKRIPHHGIAIRLQVGPPLRRLLPLLHPDPLPRELHLLQHLRLRLRARLPFCLCLFSRIDQPCQLALFSLQFPQSLNFLLPEEEHVDEVFLRRLVDEGELVDKFGGDGCGVHEAGRGENSVFEEGAVDLGGLGGLISLCVGRE